MNINFIKNPDLTARQANSLLKAELKRRNLPFEKISAQTVSFAGFGYGSSIFVEIHKWTTNQEAFQELRAFAASKGFHVEIASHADKSPVFSGGI